MPGGREVAGPEDDVVRRLLCLGDAREPGLRRAPEGGDAGSCSGCRDEEHDDGDGRAVAADDARPLGSDRWRAPCLLPAEGGAQQRRRRRLGLSRGKRLGLLRTAIALRDLGCDDRLQCRRQWLARPGAG